MWLWVGPWLGCGDGLSEFIDTPTDTVDDTPTLELYPRDLLVAPGAVVPLRAVLSVGGVRSDVAASLTAVDPSIARIDAGRLVAVAPGSTEVIGSLGVSSSTMAMSNSHGTASLRVRVVAEAPLQVTVVDAATRAPIHPAFVLAPATVAVTDTLGEAELSVADPSVAWVTVVAAGFVATTVQRVRSRQIVIPMRRYDGAVVRRATVDLAAVPPVAGALAVGMVAPDVGPEAVLYDPNTLFSPDVDAIPGNIASFDRAEVSISGRASTEEVWAFAGAVPISRLVDVSGREGAADLLVGIGDRLRWGSASWDDDEIELKPTLDPCAAQRLSVPPPTDGAAANLLALRGSQVVGIGRGIEDVMVWTCDPPALRARPRRWLAFAHPGGLDGVTRRYATIISDSSRFAEWLAIPSMGPWLPGRGFSADFDARTTLVRVAVSDGQDLRDIWLPPVDFDAPGDGLSIASGAQVRITAIALDRDTWDGALTTGLSLAAAIASATDTRFAP
jgi:hypothetical protein